MKLLRKTGKKKNQTVTFKYRFKFARRSTQHRDSHLMGPRSLAMLQRCVSDSIGDAVAVKKLNTT